MKQDETMTTFDVIIVGGGATGAGTARDCARRGLHVLLLERSDIATGATGRNHGLLHSGARYAVTDNESAEECIKENRILRHIASHVLERFRKALVKMCQRTMYAVSDVFQMHQIQRTVSSFAAE